MKNLVILFASFLPFICVLFFANPEQGEFTRNAGSLASTFIAGLIGFVVVKKYGEKYAVASSLSWFALLGVGLWVASLFK